MGGKKKIVEVDPTKFPPLKSPNPKIDNLFTKKEIPKATSEEVKDLHAVQEPEEPIEKVINPVTRAKYESLFKKSGKAKQKELAKLFAEQETRGSYQLKNEIYLKEELGARNTQSLATLISFANGGPYFKPEKEYTVKNIDLQSKEYTLAALNHMIASVGWGYPLQRLASGKAIDYLMKIVTERIEDKGIEGISPKDVYETTAYKQENINPNKKTYESPLNTIKDKIDKAISAAELEP
ncbi:MAG: hypothetical protein HRT47_13965 [Candidatus Caenarcaniphilales bacterium]|nr:hypothetical protein [Candidatus Caenarcaniphilales bacterium]